MLCVTPDDIYPFGATDIQIAMLIAGSLCVLGYKATLEISCEIVQQSNWMLTGKLCC
jgi:hypothetical protein